MWEKRMQALHSLIGQLLAEREKDVSLNDQNIPATHLLPVAVIPM